jgi:hypothetical protein
MTAVAGEYSLDGTHESRASSAHLAPALLEYPSKSGFRQFAFIVANSLGGWRVRRIIRYFPAADYPTASFQAVLTPMRTVIALVLKRSRSEQKKEARIGQKKMWHPEIESGSSRFRRNATTRSTNHYTSATLLFGTIFHTYDPKIPSLTAHVGSM